ncbi:MAG: DUF3604 domain-containing protein [Pseudomonadales bacterium]
MRRLSIMTCLSALLWQASSFAEAPKPYSKATQQDYPQNLYWGDTHLHSRNSADAYSLGNMNLTPADAYRFAKGQALTAHTGEPVQLLRPLDFLVVSDHAEYLGGYYRFNVGDPLVRNTAAGKQWQQFIEEGNPTRMMASFTGSINDPENHPPFPEEVRRTIWQDVAQTADEYNDPGRFTAFTGYEWTSMIEGNNLHRVVIYADGADKAGLIAPFSAQDSTDPRDLWRALATYEATTGGKVLAIAHNGNLSNGMMFPDKSVDGKPLNREYAQLRSRWEPIYEVTQVKGDGEAHPTLSPADKFADFENWDADNIGRTQEKEDWMLAHEYARGALKLGLGFEASLGDNPFKFGMIGSTDGHNTFSTTAEDNFFGKFPESEPSPARTKNAMAADQLWQNWRIVASGYAAIWAKENTREALFDAMQRKEVYATTGSRITVRFFGGFDYPNDLMQQPGYLDAAYKHGVPMGGDLTKPAKKSSPTFLVSAAKDPVGANLDRIQIIKGWRTRDGQLQEQVYDVALSDGRQSTDSGAPEVGSTVNVAEASYRNTIGAATLAASWTDPDFNPKLRAVYYARVIEIPTPRWTAYDAKHFGLELPDEVPMTVQDRAYTSPIWYTP